METTDLIKNGIRIRYISDLHLEFQRQTIDDYFDIGKDADVVVCAGDISVGAYNARELERLAEAIYPLPMIYVSGNHDYYHTSKPRVNTNLRELDKKVENFHFLNRKSIEIDGVIFIGATGWQDSPEYDFINYPNINDFRLIQNHNEDVYQYGRLDKDFIVGELENHKDKDAVVITHIPPCKDAIKFGTHEADSKGKYIKTYYNEWDDILNKYSPFVWICGHCHDSIQVVVNETIIVRNALGYIGSDRENFHFNKFATIVI